MQAVAATSLIWVAVIAAAFVGAVLRGFEWQSLLPYAVIAALPAIISGSMQSLLDREWARLLVIFAWLALAITACLSMGLWPFGLLFLCPVVLAALFEREAVIEALILSAVIGSLIFFAHRNGALPPLLASPDGIDWGRLALPAGIAAMTLGALFFAAQSRSPFAGQDGPAANLLESSPSASLYLDENNIIIHASKSSRALLGLKASEQTLGAVGAGDANFQDKLGDLVRRARSEKTTVTETLVMRSKDIDSVFEVTAAAHHKHLMLHAVDMSEREREIQSLRASKADMQKEIDDKTLFFSGVSHELRTPLNAIIGFSDMIRDRLFGPLPSKYAEYADIIHESGQHMLDLIGDVLDMSKVDAGQYELQYGSFDMADVIRSSIKMIQPSADAASVQIALDLIPQDDLILEADRKAVRQILLNLLSNAVKFTPKGGKVTITAKSLADTLHLSVQDNGMGMSAADLKTVGQPYVQTKNAARVDARGTGLGLSLVKSLVDLHAGRFAIASQPKEGTSVDIYFPLDKPED